MHKQKETCNESAAPGHAPNAELRWSFHAVAVIRYCSSLRAAGMEIKHPLREVAAAGEPHPLTALRIANGTLEDGHQGRAAAEVAMEQEVDPFRIAAPAVLVQIIERLLEAFVIGARRVLRLLIGRRWRFRLWSARMMMRSGARDPQICAVGAWRLIKRR